MRDFGGGLRGVFRYISRNIAFGVTMRLVAAFLLLLLSPPALARVVTDAAGRQVEVPDRVERVLPAGPPAAVLLYTIDPALMAGWAHAPSAEARAFLDAAGRALPEVGALTHGGAADPAAIARWQPDLILDFGSVTPRYAALADQIQAATHVPYLLLDGSLAGTPETYRMLGALLGRPARGAALAAAAERLLKAADPAAGGALSYYCGRTASGLTSAGPGSIMVEVPRLLGLRSMLPDGRSDTVAVDRRQLLDGHPDLVLTSDPAFATALRSDPAWQGLAGARLLLAPRRPFGWIDEPPSVNRLLGLVWLSWQLHPGPRAPLEAAVRDFYHLFYRVDLDDAGIADLLGPPPTPGGTP
jgi:iron complex transport system substrate-binding protein